MTCPVPGCPLQYTGDFTLRRHLQEKHRSEPPLISIGSSKWKWKKGPLIFEELVPFVSSARPKQHRKRNEPTLDQAMKQRVVAAPGLAMAQPTHDLPTSRNKDSIAATAVRSIDDFSVEELQRFLSDKRLAVTRATALAKPESASTTTLVSSNPCRRIPTHEQLSRRTEVETVTNNSEIMDMPTIESLVTLDLTPATFSRSPRIVPEEDSDEDETATTSTVNPMSDTHNVCSIRAGSKSMETRNVDERVAPKSLPILTEENGRTTSRKPAEKKMSVNASVTMVHGNGSVQVKPTPPAHITGRMAKEIPPLPLKVTSKRTPSDQMSSNQPDKTVYKWTLSDYVSTKSKKRETLSNNSIIVPEKLDGLSTSECRISEGISDTELTRAPVSSTSVKDLSKISEPSNSTATTAEMPASPKTASVTSHLPSVSTAGKSVPGGGMLEKSVLQTEPSRNSHEPKENSPMADVATDEACREMLEKIKITDYKAMIGHIAMNVKKFNSREVARELHFRWPQYRLTDLQRYGILIMETLTFAARYMSRRDPEIDATTMVWHHGVVHPLPVPNQPKAATPDQHPSSIPKQPLPPAKAAKSWDPVVEQQVPLLTLEDRSTARKSSTVSRPQNFEAEIRKINSTTGERADTRPLPVVSNVKESTTRVSGTSQAGTNQEGDEQQVINCSPDECGLYESDAETVNPHTVGIKRKERSGIGGEPAGEKRQKKEGNGHHQEKTPTDLRQKLDINNRRSHDRQVSVNHNSHSKAGKRDDEHTSRRAMEDGDQDVTEETWGSRNDWSHGGSRGGFRGWRGSNRNSWSRSNYRSGQW